MGEVHTGASVPKLADVRSKVKGRPVYLRRAWRRLRRDKLALAALGLLVVIVALALAAPLISEHILQTDPNRGAPDAEAEAAEQREPPGDRRYGRDTAARLLHAGRVSLTFGFMVMAIDLVIGVALGLTAGYFGGRIDDAINALIQIINNIPTIFLLIALAVLFRPGVVGLAVLFGLLAGPA
jgi:ABC-type dipeptide/oligopeptide/nickel transport system permease subunit